MLIQTLAALRVAGAVAAPLPQSYQPKKARRHFVSITVDTRFVKLCSFANHPLEQLLGQPVSDLFDIPLAHTLHQIPICVRGTVTF